MATRPRSRTGYHPRPPMRPALENFKPKSEWKYEENATTLLVHLPGFVKEQIRVMFTSVDNIHLAIKVEGQRHLGGGRWSQFNENYEIPENHDINKISCYFERGFLTIVMQKIIEAKRVSADKEENKATPEISSAQEKAETSAVEKQTEDKDVEARSQKQVTSEEKSLKGRDEAPPKTGSPVDTAEKFDEKRVGSGSEIASEKAEEKSPKGRDEAPPKTTSSVDTAEKIDTKRVASGSESASEKADGKSQESQGEASPKTATLVDSAEKMDGKKVGSEGESAYEKADGKSEKGQDEASTKITALVDTAEKIDEKKLGSGGESAYEKTDEKKQKSEAIEKQTPAEAEKPESGAVKSKEFSSALDGAVAQNTEEKQTIIDKSEKPVNDIHKEQKMDTIIGKSKDTNDESASASEGSPDRKHLLLNIGTAVLVIVGLGAYISYSVGSELGFL